jgi:SAM-dependent methyltransferase
MTRKIIDYIRINLSEFLKTELEQLEPDTLVLDAGAGDPDFQVRDERLRFVSFDLCVGQEDWDYSAIDAVGDLVAIPFRENVFGAVICSQVLEHVPEPAAVLAELHRVLHPEGKLLLTVPQEWYLHQPPHDYFRFTKYALQHLLDKTGFRIQKILPMGGYFLLMSHRIALFPRFFFPPKKNILVSILRKPFKEIFELFFMRVLPIFFKYLDKYDDQKFATAGYKVVAVKKQHSVN